MNLFFFHIGGIESCTAAPFFSSFVVFRKITELEVDRDDVNVTIFISNRQIIDQSPNASRVDNKTIIIMVMTRQAYS